MICCLNFILTMVKDEKYTDAELIAELLSGKDDVLAYERIFHRYYPMVSGFIRGMLKDDAMAEDVAQNIFMKLWINRFRLKKETCLRSWLYVLAKNEALNILRSKRANSIVLQPDVQETKISESTVEDWYNYVETNARLRNDIEAMPPQRRMIFNMSRYENLSNLEIAIRLNLSVRTVEKHIELALKDLRRSKS